jgi:hypothetical protein
MGIPLASQDGLLKAAEGLGLASQCRAALGLRLSFSLIGSIALAGLRLRLSRATTRLAGMTRSGDQKRGLGRSHHGGGERARQTSAAAAARR